MKSTRSNLASRYSVAFILCLTSLMILMASALSVSPNSSSASSSPSNARISATATPTSGPISRTITSPTPLPPAGPALTATKTDSPGTPANPGDTIMYTVVISSTGTTDATNVIFTDTIDPNTTLSGVAASSPIAFDDTYTASGNIPIAPATSLLANDIDPDSGTNAGLTVTQVQGGANVGIPTNTTAVGIGLVHGTVTVAANGTFTYQPPPGYTGDDTFTYQISDASLKTGSGSVKITISNMVWFIDNTSAAANSRGTFTEPFKTIAAFNAINTTGVAPNAQNGHHVVIRPASGSYAETDGVNLRDSQTLTGPAVAFNTVFTADANSTSAYNTFAAGTGTAAAITATAGNGVDLGSGNALRGFNIGNTPGFFGVNGTAVGSLTVATVGKTGTGGAIQVTTSGAFASAVSFLTLESTSSATSNINLFGVTGTLTVGSGGTGLSGSTLGSPAINVNGGSVTMSYPGNVTKTNTTSLLSVTGHTGTLTFTGTLNASGGDGLQFNNADGTYNFNGTTTLAGGDAGVDILTGSGGTFSFGSGTTITNPSGTAFNVNGSSPSVTYSGSISQSTASQRVVNIDTTASNTILFQTGTITGGASSTGVNLNAATGNVTFSNGMTMGTSGARMTNTAVTINTGSAPAIYDLGVVSIFTTGAAKGIVSTNTGGEIRTSASSVVNAAGAAAIDISAAASTPLLMTFTSVTANGGTNGIRLLKTSGSFTVTGDGASDPANTTRGRTTAKNGGGSITLGSGGTINNMTGPAVSLNTASNVTLRNLQLTGNAGGVNSGGDGINAQTVTTMTLDNVLVQSHPGNDGLFGSGVSALTMQHTDIHSNATTSGVESPDVWNVRIDNLTGTSTISNSLFFDSFENVFFIQNAGASNLTLTVTNSEFRDTSTAGAGNVAFGLSADGTCVTTLTATGSKFANSKTNGFQYAGVTSSSGTVKVQNSTFDQCGVDVNIAHQSAGQTLTYEVSGNTMRQTFKANCSTSTNIFLGGLSTAGTLMTGTVKNNTIGNAAVANSGSDLGAGIGMNATGAGTLTANVTGNTVVQVRANSGNVFDAGILGTSKLNLNLHTNTFNGTPGQVNPQYGVHINNGSGSPGETGVLCWNMGGNTVTMPASAIASIDLDAFPGTSSNLVGYGGAANNSAQIMAFFSSANTSVTPAPLYTAAGGNTQAATPPCSTFVFPTFVTPGPIAQSAVPVSDGPAESSTQSNDELRSTWGEAANSESAERLNQQTLNFAVQAAIERWRQTGISPEDLARLQAVSFEIGNLPGDLLALSGAQIKIDETAAGYGWFVDAFPLDDSNFRVLVPNKELQTNELSPANGKMDLLTVVMREMGSVLLQGQTKATKRTRENLRPLMEDTLSPGVRRMPLDLLRVTPLSPIGSTLGPVDKRLLAQSNSTDQPEATGAGIESAVAQSQNETARFGQARYAALYSATDQATGFAGPKPTPAMIRIKNTGGTSTPSANRAVRVGSLKPMSGETVTVNGSGSGFTIPVGKSVTIMFSVTVNAADTFLAGTTQVCNQGFVSATGIPSFGTTDPGPPVVNGPTCTQLNVADVSATKSAGSGTTCSTSNIVYTIGYHNAGPASALAVVVSDPMPAGTILVSAPAPANWTRTDSVPVGGNGTIMFSRTGPSPNGESASFTVTVSIDGTVTDGSVLSNTASVTSTTPDPNTANNTSSPVTTVTVKRPPTPATVGGPQTICALGTTTGLGGNTPTIGTGTWTVQSGGTGTFNPSATTPGATFTHLTGAGPIVLRWTISNPPCPDSFAEVTVTVRAQPTATVGGPQTICALGTTASLGGNTPTPPATGTWSIVTAGVVGTFNPNATTPGATFTHTSGAIGSTATLRWTVSNAPCTDATADVVITIKSQPTATAGGPFTICSGGTTPALGGNTPPTGATGTWSIVTAGVVGAFNPDANTPGATFTHTSGGVATTITLRWTVSNAPCTAATADVSVTIKSQPVATVGGPQTICQGGTTATLGGNTPPVGATGTWSIVTAGVVGTFNPNATTPGATFTHTSGAIGSTVTLRWTVSNAPCSDATADVVVTIKSQPTATAGGPQTICSGGTTAALGGNTPPVGATGTWSIVTAGITGTFNPNATTPGATFTHATGATSPFTLRWTVTNAPCTSATADVTITLQPAPLSTNGGNQSVCENGTTAGLGGNTPIAGETGTWSIVTGGATGTFAPNANTPNATFSPTSGAGTITLRWSVNNATCGATATSDVIVTVKLQPTATVGGPQTICALGTTASLGGNTPAGGGTGMWSVVGGGTGTFNPNATTPGATFTHATGAGPITVRWTVSNAPCANATADVVITITQPPTPATVGGPQTICQGSTTASLGGNTPTTGTGMWTIQTGGATGTFNPNASTPGATFTPTSGTGGIVLRWTISNPPCTASFAEVTITVKLQPTATAGGPQTICALGTTASLGGNTPAGGATGLWTVVGGGTGTFNPNATTPGATFTHATGTGPITLRWTVSNAPCTDATADVVITITQSPTPATVGGPQTICALSTTAGLGGNTPTSGTGTWTVQSGGTGTFNPNATTPNATFTHATGTGPIVLRWTIAAAPCPSSFAEVTITITQSPTPATVGGPQTICALSTTAGLGGNAPSSGTGMWTIQSGGAGTFNPNATTPNATFTHTSGTGPIVLRWTITNAPCPASFAEVTITITQSPTPATVGGPQTICALSTTAGLGGNTPTSGTGTWTVQSGGAGTFNPNANTGNATFTHTSGAGPIVLRWTIANAPCPASFAEVTITIVQGPTPATVGGPQTICALSTTAGLGGNAPSSGTGMWTVQSGGAGTFSPNANTGNATFTHTSGTGPIVLRWTISNAPCPASFAEVTITITQPPTPATVGGPQTICALSTTTGLGGNTPTSGTGTWTVQSGGAGTFNPNANTGNATFTHTSGAGPIVLRWTIANAACPASFAEVTITIVQGPTPATVGGPQTICQGSATTGLGGNTPSSGTGTWTVQSGGTGTFNPNANTGNATFTSTSGAGTFVLRWTISSPPCPNSFAEVTVTVKLQPTATTSGNQTICALSTTASLGGNTPAGGATGAWSIVGGGTGTFNPNATTPGATFTHTGGTGPITLRWTVSNPPCTAATADVVLTIKQPPTTATVGGNQTITPGGTTAPLGGNTPASGTGTWTIATPGFTGTFNPNAATPNATWTHLTGSGQVKLRWTISNPPCPDSFAEVTIQIGVPPTITCPASPIVVSNDPGQCSASVSFTVTATGIPAPTVTCKVGAMVITSPHTFPVGSTTVTCTASNGVAPDATCSFVVTVNDTQPPSITCPANITKTADPNLCSAIVTYPPPTVSDNCPGVGTPTCSPASGSAFPVGTTTVTCSVKDMSNNMNMCTFTVKVIDTQPPTITCPANIFVAAAAACPIATSRTVHYTVTATDNCGLPVGQPVCSPPTDSVFPVGTTTVTCTATDASGNSASCSFTVTVFSACLVDESNPGNVVLFNTQTGAYRFCCNGQLLATGTGQMVMNNLQRCIGSIDEFKGARKVHIQFDFTAGGVGKGTASLFLDGSTNPKCMILDKSMAGNACTCANGGSAAVVEK